MECIQETQVEYKNAVEKKEPGYILMTEKQLIKLIGGKNDKNE